MAAARLLALGLLACLLGAAVAEEEPVVPLELLPLHTSGRWILDNKGQRFRLRCANWYGASGELHVVHGMHKRTMNDLVDELRGFGFNCVRLPFSLELFFEDPLVPEHALVAEPSLADTSLTGLKAYDAVVEAITAAGLLVLVDNHSSDSGWCCKVGAPDGAWFTQTYPEDRWIEALVAMAQRFRNNTRVIGVDLRNEVRDTPAVHTVWGESFSGVESGKEEADWPAAAERAGNAVLAENPDLLVLVTGLCFGQDLRGVRSRPVELNVPGRLVWTVHSYHWYFWFYSSPRVRAAVQKVVAICAVTAAVSAVCSIAVYCRGFRTSWRAFVEVLLTFVTSTGLGLVVAAQLVQSPACADFEQRERYPWNISAIVILVAAFLGWALCLLVRRIARRRIALGASQPEAARGKERWGGTSRCKERVLPSFCCLALASTALAVLLGPGHDWRIPHQIHRHWGFVLEAGQPYTAPVVLGEFGTRVRDTFWLGLVDYVAEHDLDFAYWPFNGQKWNHEKDRWVKETYGLLSASWARVRHDWKLNDLQNI